MSVFMRFAFGCWLTLRLCQAVAFLQRPGDETGAALLADLASVLGPGNDVHGQLSVLETRIRTTALTLPRNHNGLFGYPTARYAMERLMLDLYGWRITGLDHNATELSRGLLQGSGILAELLPRQVAEVFVKHVHREGFGLRDLAILAAAFEHFALEHQRDLLTKACEAFLVPTRGQISEKALITILQSYMAVLLFEVRDMKESIRAARKSYPGWRDVTILLKDEVETAAHMEGDTSNPFKERPRNLAFAQRLVKRIMNRFVRIQNEGECQEMKHDLMEYERGATGRVLIRDFYRADATSRFFFTESEGYLRAIGALDESNVKLGPQVMVPNYIQARTNCVAKSYAYSFCCVNECDGLLGHIERGLESANPTAEQILALVANLSSSTVQAHRNLTGPLRLRLEEVEAAHYGRVPIHGRLFAQWMHFAFPRECCYPHKSGATTTLHTTAWEKSTRRQGLVENASEKVQKLKEVEVPDDELDSLSHFETMWSSHEELLFQPTRSVLPVWREYGVPSLACIGFAISIAGMVLRFPTGHDGLAKPAHYDL